MCCWHAVYGRGLVTCTEGQVRPWISMQLLGSSVDSLIGSGAFRNRTIFFRFANQMLTVCSALTSAFSCSTL